MNLPTHQLAGTLRLRAPGPRRALFWFAQRVSRLAFGVVSGWACIQF